jgi:hypothetical protein
MNLRLHELGMGIAQFHTLRSKDPEYLQAFTICAHHEAEPTTRFLRGFAGSHSAEQIPVIVL